MPFALSAEGFRVATFYAELTRKGPGLLLRDIERGNDKQISALKLVVAAVEPDVLLLTKVDFDLEQRSAAALRDALGYPHMFTLAPNTMITTQLDLNGDKRVGDRQAWARYAGEGAMLLLSKHPVELRYHLNNLLWKDAPRAQMPEAGFLSALAIAELKVVSQGLWVVEVVTAKHGPITLVAFQNQTPVFDGPQDFNGLRNRAQLRLLNDVMEGAFGDFPLKRFVLLGNSNLDPKRGDGDRAAIGALLADKRLSDAKPLSTLGGDTTAQWENPDSMRVSYVLPSADWKIKSSGVFWPDAGPLHKAAEQPSRHRLVWIDIRPPP